MLMTVDEEGKMLPVPCRVGQAVDVVAQAGKPKTITGFQTHNTPVSGLEGLVCPADVCLQVMGWGGAAVACGQ
jgi:hypothetical protein